MLSPFPAPTHPSGSRCQAPCFHWADFWGQCKPGRYGSLRLRTASPSGSSVGCCPRGHPGPSTPLSTNPFPPRRAPNRQDLQLSPLPACAERPAGPLLCSGTERSRAGACGCCSRAFTGLFADNIKLGNRSANPGVIPPSLTVPPHPLARSHLYRFAPQASF